VKIKNQTLKSKKKEILNSSCLWEEKKQLLNYPIRKLLEEEGAEEEKKEIFSDEI